MLKQKDYSEWVRNPITKAVFKILDDRSKYYMRTILDGVPESNRNQILTLGEHIGRVNAYNEIIAITFEEFLDENPASEGGYDDEQA